MIADLIILILLIIIFSLIVINYSKYIISYTEESFYIKKKINIIYNEF